MEHCHRVCFDPVLTVHHQLKNILIEVQDISATPKTLLSIERTGQWCNNQSTKSPMVSVEFSALSN